MIKLVMIMIAFSLFSCDSGTTTTPTTSEKKTIFIRLSQTDRDSTYKVITGTVKMLKYDSTIH